MQNFNSNTRSPPPNAPQRHQQQDFQKVFHRLKDLHEVQDESRNELCPVFLDEQSFIKSRRESNWSQHQPQTQVNILKELEETSQLDKHDPPKQLSSSKRSTYNHLQDNDLRESNRKLQQDNRKLFNQCIRLRKLCKIQDPQDEPFRKKDQREGLTNLQLQLQRDNKSLRLQIQELRTQNRSLAEKLKIIQQQISSQQLLADRYQRMRFDWEQAARENKQLMGRLSFLEQELEAANSRSASKSNQSISINNSTQQSRKTEVEKDRMITNMKIVHQSEKLKLKNTIEELKKQLGRQGQQSGFSNQVNVRRT